MVAGRAEEADRRDLADVAEDLLDELVGLRKDLRPILSVFWILLGLVVVVLLVSLASALVGGLSG